MDSQIDTAQRRAEAVLQAYCGADDEEWAVAKQHNATFDDVLIRAIADLLRQARRDALEEASKVVREWVKHYPTNIFIEPLPGQHGRTVDACSASAIRAICPAIADALDRLREGVGG